ncbi:hypothetical protein PIB30_035564 [Stylosanthes scabra]|uniref:F-box domain-containing protein n=1 Tax=Stylosanthes scabra TaxID=79078 RepID=A0ABU6TCW8_9FABA|nr:hypothetical protein [Stylosanthes scabra]
MKSSRKSSIHESFETALTHLPEEVLWKIFVKLDSKTVGRCRALSRCWEVQLNSHDFIKQHWDESKLKRATIIIGAGQNHEDDKSEWLFTTDLDNASQVQFNIPTNVNQERYTIVGSDRGILCLQLYRLGNSSKLMGVYHPIKLCWSEPIKFNLCVSKLGPNHVVQDGVVHWIGWGGEEVPDLLSIITFDMNINKFYETEVPVKAKADFDALTKYNGGVGFFTQTKVELGTRV